MFAATVYSNFYVMHHFPFDSSLLSFKNLGWIDDLGFVASWNETSIPPSNLMKTSAASWDGIMKPPKVASYESGRVSSFLRNSESILTGESHCGETQGSCADGVIQNPKNPYPQGVIRTADLKKLLFIFVHCSSQSRPITSREISSQGSTIKDLTCGIQMFASQTYPVSPDRSPLCKRIQS